VASAATARVEGFWSHSEGNQARTAFAARGIRCASCSKAIERAVGAVPGVRSVQVNVATSRISVDFDSSQTALPAILAATEKAGFQPVPLLGGESQAESQRERRTALKRIGLAGIGMMQVMMYVLGVYVATPESMDPAIASYLRFVGLLITTPVLFYSGAPYLLGALQDLRRRTLGMDVPVAIALCLAYAASVLNTVRGSGQTYFDSVTMFIFFLGAGRYLEM
jgi:Cu2+-exporting ATPase